MGTGDRVPQDGLFEERPVVDEERDGIAAANERDRTRMI
jgi:hypothetical protein